MILGVHAIRGHRTLFDALLPHGAVIRVKSGLVKKIFWATPPLHVPRDVRRGEPRGLRHLTAELERLSIPDLIAREREHGPEAALAAIECHRCPWGATTRCDAAARDLERLDERVAQKRAALDAFRNAYWQEFLRVVEVLEQFGAVRDGGLLAKGRLIASLRHDNELLLAETMTRGLFDDLAAAEAAALCSALLEESRSGEPAVARAFLKKRPKLKQRLDRLVGAAEAVWQAQRARQLGIPVSVHPGFMPSVFRWASGEDDWAGIVAESFGGHEGDLVRAMRRLIDLLRQLAEGPDVPVETARVLTQAARAVDRGIVLESALV
jgi:superfamily II RNA helicase